MSLITFKGKPLEKLVEVISQGIGTLHKPRSIRKEADANAYKINVIAKAKAQAASESKLIEVEMYDVIEQRILFQEQRKQNNIASIIDVATEQINQESNVSSEAVDPDWTTRFFSIAENISNEEMQKLWGRILAGEVKNPNSFSLRTLEALKNITKHEAEIFAKFAQLKIKLKNTSLIPYNDSQRLENKFNIPYSEILLLTELGLISSGSTLGLVFKSTEVPVEALYEIGEIGILVKTTPHKSPHSIKILAFTKTGIELSNLITQELNSEYIEYVCNALTTHYTKIIFGKLDYDGGTRIIKHPTEYEN